MQYRFVASDTDYAPDDWRCLFNRPLFHEVNREYGLEPLVVDIRDDDGDVLGSLVGVRDRNRFLGGFNAPFGGLEVIGLADDPRHLARVVREGIARLQHCGITEIQLKTPPSCYTSAEPLVQAAVLKNRFTVERAEMNHHIDVRRSGGGDGFVALLAGDVRRALRRFDLGGGTVLEVVEDERFAREHAMLAATRAPDGCPFTTTLEYVHSARLALRSNLRLFEVRSDSVLLGAALLYDVTASSSLATLWTDREDQAADAAAAALLRHMVTLAAARNINTLDISIAGGDARQQSPLAAFGDHQAMHTESRFTLRRSV